MVPGNDNDFYELTFSQREGNAPLPEPMKLKHVSKRFRQLAWQHIDNMSYGYKPRTGLYGEFYGYYYVDENARKVIDSYQFDVLLTSHDVISSHTAEKDRGIVRAVLLDKDYHAVLTFLEFVLRHEKCPYSLRNVLIKTFDETPIAYHAERINGQLTVLPRASHEAGKATRQAIKTLHGTGMEGAATHLRQAAEHINAGQYGDSIADSIHAVESVAKNIDQRANKTLGPALDSLEKAGLLKHPALKEAFKKLYGYTNDEQGIRHALIDKDSPSVGLDEAMFMFGACASFAAYLVSKHRQSKKLQDSSQ